MAIMIPDTVKEPTVSQAERRLFNRLKRELPDDAVVLHSLGLAGHPQKLWGEGDFVVISRLGVFVIEVKGGGVSCEDGLWTFTDRYGQTYTKTEGPFEQASSAMFAVRDAIRQHTDVGRILIGYGVIMPDETFEATGPEIEPGVLLDKRRFHEDLGDYLARLSAFWTKTYSEKHEGPVPVFPSAAQSQAIRKALRPEIRTAYTLNSQLAQLETDQVELTEEQCNILRRLDSNPRTLVTGAAGTGKTLLAMDLAVRLAEAGSRVLFLCYNRLLGEHLRQHVNQRNLSELLDADHLHSWFDRAIESAELGSMLSNRPSDDDEFFGPHYASVFSEAIVQLGAEPYDYLIVDEGQDLLTAPFLDAFDLSLKGGLAEGCWSVFMDPQQAIYAGVDEEMLGQLRGYGIAEFGLTVNCRNAREVAVSTAIVSGIEMPLEDVVEGGRTAVEFFQRGEDRHAMLERWLKKLGGEGVTRSDIVILSRLRPENCGLDHGNKVAEFRLHDLTKDEDRIRRGIDVCTMQAFKGLERRAVIAWELGPLDDAACQMLHYCGLSRARTCLIVFLEESQREAYERFAAEFGRRMATQ